MTFSQVWIILRWPLALVGLFLVANYALSNLSEAAGGMIEFDASGSILAPAEDATETEDPLGSLPTEPEPVATLAPGTGPVEAGQSAPLAEFYVTGTAADTDDTVLVLSDNADDSIVVAFDYPPGDPSCMASVELVMTAADVLSTTEIGIFPSSIDDPAGVIDDQAVPGDLRASPNAMAMALIEVPGTLAIDITAGYQSYFTQGFPEGKPFTLTIAASAPVDSLGGVRFASSSVEGEGVPTLQWAGIPDCGGPGELPTE